MKVVRSIPSARRLTEQWKLSGVSVALVPTMGFLHQGHLSLVDFARKKVGESGKVILSIYVNPTQFGPTEDFQDYPRNLRADLQRCRHRGVDAVFTPDDESMFPWRKEGRKGTFVIEEERTQSMEGVSRPTHFRGVTTVVAKLFGILNPDYSIFGSKDFQQAMVIRKMVVDLNFRTKVEIAPTAREKDGLAISSRNIYLSTEQRQQAFCLRRSLLSARKLVRGSATGLSSKQMKSRLEKELSKYSEARLDYIEFFESRTMKTVRKVSRGDHMALAVYFGNTRLIDNGKL